jgi:hypothetical protein
MANVVLTPSIIARESLMVLENNMVLANLVYHDYSNDFVNVGDTITIRKPSTFTVDEFDGEIKIQDAAETGVPVKMDKLLDISFKVTNKDMTLSIVDFSQQFLAPAMRAFAQDIDSRLASLYVDVPFQSGAAGVTPSTVGQITDVRRVMNNNKVPLIGRNMVLNTDADASLLKLDAFNRVDASGTNAALVEAQLGRKFGFDIYMDQNIKTHNIGTVTYTPALTVSAATEAGVNSAVFAGTTLTGIVKKGTTFTVAGDTQTYVVAADSTAAANAVTVPFYPASAAAWAASAVVTVTANHAANLAFHRNAFAMVSRQLSQPMGVANSSYVNYNGLGLRVTYGYDITTKADIVSIDMLCGFKTVQPELAARVLG